MNEIISNGEDRYGRNIRTGSRSRDRQPRYEDNFRARNRNRNEDNMDSSNDKEQVDYGFYFGLFILLIFFFFSHHIWCTNGVGYFVTKQMKQTIPRPNMYFYIYSLTKLR